MNCGVLVSLQRQKRVFPREKEKSCQTERRILDGSKSEREKAKKSKQQHKSVKMGELDILCAFSVSILRPKMAPLFRTSA